jgi:hypothetical protein
MYKLQKPCQWHCARMLIAEVLMSVLRMRLSLPSCHVWIVGPLALLELLERRERSRRDLLRACLRGRSCEICAFSTSIILPRLHDLCPWT